MVHKIDLFDPRFVSPLDVLVKNFFDQDAVFNKPDNRSVKHPVDVFEDDGGLTFEVACTGLTKKDVVLDIEGDTLKISYTKPEKEELHPGIIHNGLSKKSFDLRYKIAPKFDLGNIDATLANGLLEIFIPLAEEAKPKSIKIK